MLVLSISASFILPGMILTIDGRFVSADEIKIIQSAECFPFPYYIQYQYIFLDDLVTMADISYAKFLEPANNDLKILFCEILLLPINLSTSDRCFGLGLDLF